MDMLYFKDFLKQIEKKKTDEEKKELIKTHIVRNYVPFGFKIERCNAILEIKETHIKVSGSFPETISKSIARYIEFITHLISLYTDIYIDDYIGSGASLDVYLSLEDKGILYLFLECLPQQDLLIFQKFFEWTINEEEGIKQYATNLYEQSKDMTVEDRKLFYINKYQ